MKATAMDLPLLGAVGRYNDLYANELSLDDLPEPVEDLMRRGYHLIQQLTRELVRLRQERGHDAR